MYEFVSEIIVPVFLGCVLGFCLGHFSRYGLIMTVDLPDWLVWVFALFCLYGLIWLFGTGK